VERPGTQTQTRQRLASAPAASRRAPVPFIVGVGRSGTTLLRLMLDAHAALAIPPETHFLPDLIARFAAASSQASPSLVEADEVVEVITSGRHWADFGLEESALLERLRAAAPLDAAGAIRSFFQLYAEREGKPRWGDKTPIYVKSMREIEAVLPEARFIHLIRDGRDVALSRAGRALHRAAPLSKVARRWKRRIVDARGEGEQLSGYLEIRYEDLVLDTEPTLRRVCELIELPWDEAMLAYHERAAQRLAEFGDLPGVGGKPQRPGSERLAAHAKTREPPDPGRLARWKTEMSSEDQAAFERAAGDLLADLGYEVRRGATVRRTLSRLLRPVARARRSRKVARQSGGGRVRVREPAAAEAPADAIPGHEGPPAPFVVGVTRSGTTLLRMMLDAHPQLTIPPETHFLPDLIEASREEHASPERLHEVVVRNRRWGDFHLDGDELLRRFKGIKPLNAGDAARAFFELYAETQGKPRWGDKTPIYINRMMLIERALPEARFIHLIRDGRDAALSRAKRVLKEPTPMHKVAERWRNRIIRAREQGPRLGHYLELRYEDVVIDTEAALRRVCEYVDLPWDDAMLHYHERAAERMKEMHRDLPPEPGKPLRPADHRMAAHALTSEPPDPSRLGRWRTEMSPEDRAAFEEAAGDLLAELGYELEREAVKR
jgi:Sulfotransferase family